MSDEKRNQFTEKPVIEVVDEAATVTVVELCRSCGVDTGFVESMVAEGILEPEDQAEPEPRFAVTSLRRARVTVSLQRDLGVNLAGAALALDLLDQIEELRARLRRLGD